MKTRNLVFAALLLCMTACQPVSTLTPTTEINSDLHFASLSSSWDEGIPLGNATVGALVWQKDSVLRFSLDRTDLWDLRPSDSLSGENYSFEWVKNHIREKNYSPVQQKFDAPYDLLPAPSKIPGAALEFRLPILKEPAEVHLYLNNALCEVRWKNGIKMQTFVHATQPVGWFLFENLPTELSLALVPPMYGEGSGGNDGPVSGLDLQRLGYEQGKMTRTDNTIVYHQKGYGDFFYDVAVKWKYSGNKLYGSWSITSSLSNEHAEQQADSAMQRGIKQDYQAHLEYWKSYWAQSSVSLPDTILQKQYDNEMYKLGSAARENSYPISLQAVWTADNGKLPPWKGDYHHDLNTQLSYWPTYIGNHLQEGMGYLNTLWNQQDVYKQYTKEYFGKKGMNIPGVCTLTGKPMAGWIQYSMSPTIGSWLAQHFYLQWKYSMDSVFLKEKAYPFLKEVALFLEEISSVNEKGIRSLEYSSSPEFFDNSLQAWFPTITNYDLSLMSFLFGASAELADALSLKTEAEHWRSLKQQLPPFSLDEQGGLAIAEGYPYKTSHRHFSHAMSIHPLGIIDWSQGDESQAIIRATLKELKEVGPDYWCGYSYSWLANMQARAFNGEEAAQALHTFAECFCLKNTFHANGDQTKTGKSLFVYRPFTLEGNFAFASAVQEMLLQSHTGVIRVFPAIPKSWKNVSFRDLRAMGAFLVSATLTDGQVTKLSVFAEKGGHLSIVSPIDGKMLEYDTTPGSRIEIYK